MSLQINSINVELLCGSTFWNLSLAWYTENNPDLTYCFEETILLWFPCLILFLLTCFTVLELRDRKSKNQAEAEKEEIKKPKDKLSSKLLKPSKPEPEILIPIPWNIYLLSNLCICITLVIIQCIELANVFQWNYERLQPIQPIDWSSPIIKMIILIYLIYVQLLYRQHGVYSSGPIFIFALFFAIYHIINLRTILLSFFDSGKYYVEINNIHFISRTVSTYLSILHLLFNCFSHPNPLNKIRLENEEKARQHQHTPLKHRNISHQKQSSNVDNKLNLRKGVNSNDEMRELNPWITSSFLSRITFWWFNKIIWTGYRKPLIEKDIFRLEQNNSTKEVLENFQKKMDKYLKNKKQKIQTKKRRSNGYELPEDDKQSKAAKMNLGFVILRVYSHLIFLTALMKLIASTMTFINPIVLDYLISFMSSDTEPYWHGFFYATLMLIAPAFESIINNQYEYWVNILVMRCRMSITSLIYKKSLKISNYGRSQYSTGEVTNIMAVDTQRITDFLVSVNSIWAAPFQIGIAFYLLWQQVQVASMPGLAFMILVIPINAFAMRKIRGYQFQVMRQKDERTKLMNEILNGMKVLKLYAWENSFRKMITILRDSECRKLYLVTIFSGFITFAFVAAPFIVAVLTFSTYVLMGNVLDPNKAFVSLSLFSIIRVPLGLLPMLLTTGVQALVSLNRVNKYLNSEEQDETAISRLSDDECSIRIENGTFTWQRDEPATLKSINLNVPKGKLIAVVGTVGSGKSSLLSCILGDMEKLTGHVNVDGRLAYVPQQAWIRNQTVRDNITFSSQYKEQKYKKVVKNCCLEPDFKMLSNGDQTEIGERGINLSGGQKQRISLARAVYSDAQIYLLDDPLSAVDAHVGDKLFRNVISNDGLLRNKTRILATHRAMILTEVDEIIVMKDGKISERGTINELMDSQGAFAEFIVEYMDENFIQEREELIQSGNESDLAKSFAEKVRPILERSKSRTDSLFVKSTSSSGSHTNKKQIRAKKKTGRESMLSSSSYSQYSEHSFHADSSLGMLSSLSGDHALTSKPEDAGKLIQEEVAQTGSVKYAVYGRYFRKVGVGITIFILIAMITANAFSIATSLWLSAWSDDSLDPLKAKDTNLRNTRLIVYAILGASEIALSITSSITLSLACIRAAKSLHNDMLERIMFAPMSFFDTTPIGRILNRFTKDVDVADNSLSFVIRMSLMQFFRTIVAFAMISLEAPVILIAITPILILYFIIQRIYIASSRQLKRIESITRSPIYHHFTETVTGISTINAYGVQEHFLSDCNDRLDTNGACYYSSFVAARWLSVRLEFFGYLIVFLAALFAVLNRDNLSPGLAGLAVSYSLNITAVMGMFVRCLTDLETNIVSVERLIEYTEVEQERNYYDQWSQPNKRWPQKGAIRFESYSTRYRPGLDLVLRNIGFDVNPREKIGVVGRTGAGKSSLTLSLFRIIEPANGLIWIDNVDITKIGLFDLRSRITIIPQDPVLFTGNLRMNLDPFDHYDDASLWKALELAHLKDYVYSLDGQLQHKVSEGGENISVGQRQLVCLARALLRKSKILVLDEATAAVDMETDELIQKTIRREFNDCTILTIAHRLNTVIDYDRILVLDSGKIAEYDSPKTLLGRTDSIFYSMAKVAKLI